jgi:hypothetical protein
MALFLCFWTAFFSNSYGAHNEIAEQLFEACRRLNGGVLCIGDKDSGLASATSLSVLCNSLLHSLSAHFRKDACNLSF